MRSKDLPKESERQEGVNLHKVRNETPLESQGPYFDRIVYIQPRNLEKNLPRCLDPEVVAVVCL